MIDPIPMILISLGFIGSGIVGMIIMLCLAIDDAAREKRNERK